MKKLFLVFSILIASILAMAQAPNTVYTVTADTLNGAETVNFAVCTLSGHYETLNIVAKCTQVGGTSDGTLTVYGSLDNSSWVFINGVGAGTITASPKASITGADLNQVTITNGLVANWVIKDVPYKYYRVAGVGTANDSTLINIKYIIK